MELGLGLVSGWLVVMHMYFMLLSVVIVILPNYARRLHPLLIGTSLSIRNDSTAGYVALRSFCTHATMQKLSKQEYFENALIHIASWSLLTK